MSDHIHDENCEQEEQIFLIPDEDGNETEMVMVYTFEAEDQPYAVLLERQNPEAEAVIFRIEEDTDGAYLVSIEDDAEWEKVVSIYEQIAEEQE
jgi:uncharacterized protein YrzB (UPF0473 family)